MTKQTRSTNAGAVERKSCVLLQMTKYICAVSDEVDQVCTRTCSGEEIPRSAAVAEMSDLARK